MTIVSAESTTAPPIFDVNKSLTFLWISFTSVLSRFPLALYLGYILLHLYAAYKLLNTPVTSVIARYK